MGGTLPGRGHGNKNRSMHSPPRQPTRMAAKPGGIALPEELAKEKAMQEAMAHERHQMIIQVRTQAAIEIMASVICQTLNANISSPQTVMLSLNNEVDPDTLKTVTRRAAVVATYGADSLVEEMYGVTISRQPIPDENEEEEEKDETSEEDTDVEEPVKPKIVTEDD